MLPCQAGGDVPTAQGWSDLGEVACGGSVGAPYVPPDADAVVVAPKDELLWDLAWDNNFRCGPSDMFRTFLDLYRRPGGRRRPSGNPARQPLGCFVDRPGRPQRRVANRADLLGLMNATFPEVRVVEVSRAHRTAEVVDLLDDCRVVIGVHGAGIVNALFAPANASVVEILPRGHPAYYRNVCMLSGHRYEAIRATFGMDSYSVRVDVMKVQKAFIRALNQEPHKL